MSRRKPTGFVATCQCGRDVGALDLERSPREETSALLGRWLIHGCTVTPRFTGTWSAQIEQCACDADGVTAVDGKTDSSQPPSYQAKWGEPFRAEEQ